jgi:hypothetical protein
VAVGYGAIALGAPEPELLVLEDDPAGGLRDLLVAILRRRAAERRAA